MLRSSITLLGVTMRTEIEGKPVREMRGTVRWLGEGTGELKNNGTEKHWGARRFLIIS